MTRRVLGAVILATTLLGCAAVALVWAMRGHTVAAPAGPVAAVASEQPGNVAAAVVNINGRVPGGRVAGTGMVISSDGIVLTNNHVVAGTVDLTAQVAGAGPVYPATVIGVDPTHDVAVIRLEGASHMSTVPLETSGVVATGDQVTGMGNALGHNGRPVSASGTVTSLDETLGVSDHDGHLHETLNGLIQFNAAIEPGDSGGPLINAAGRVIGMDTAGATSGGFGDAIPINVAMTIANQILRGTPSAYIQSGHAGTLGVEVADGGEGALVRAVTAGQAGLGAGIAKGDLITAVGGTLVRSAADFDATMQARRPGDRVEVAWRDSQGGSHRAEVILSSGPPA